MRGHPLARNNSPSENLNLRMSISNGSQDRSTDIYFHENGSRSLDPGYDAATFGNELGSFELYSTLVENDEGRSMTIQTLGLEDIDEVRIPIGVNANQGQQLSFRIESSNLNPEIEVLYWCIFLQSHIVQRGKLYICNACFLFVFLLLCFAHLHFGHPNPLYESTRR